MALYHVTEETYTAEVENSALPVLIDFFATWCGPCRMLAPVLEELAAENPGFRIAKVDVDENPELARRFGIMTVPTLVVMKDGEPVRRASGVRPKAALLALVYGE